ncbi:hypothetical protein [Streptomyces halstedii]|uniref:Uncharacterized protein n=1 Tax=Streptomyces halstedii TaxID=1944 RepID=A0A6N9UAZ1_STRHA|nr:hypothetical protein [Streptomyces halstedii]NEA19839.1 hypothetical protein [Streptomyces halstedii]
MNTQPTPPSDAELIEHARTVGMVEPERAPEFVAAFRAQVEERSAAAGTQPVPLLDGITAEEAAANIAANAPALAATGLTHQGPHPEYGYLETHRGRLDECSGPDCGPDPERAYWQAIADALNAVEATGGSVGIDLDGTLTDHNTWSVVWDRDAVRWVVADYDDEEGEQPSTPAEPKPTQAVPGDLFTEAAIRHSALTAGADAIEALPQDYECDPGRGDAVKLLRRMAAFHTTAEQPTGLTWEARTEHAVRLYATTAIKLEDARAENAKLRERLAELEQGQADADALAAEHPDTVKQLLTAMSDADDGQAEEQPEPVTLPYVHTDIDGDTLSVRPVLDHHLDAPALIITAGDSSDHEQAAAWIPVDEVPQLVAAITQAAAVALRDQDEAGR